MIYRSSRSSRLSKVARALFGVVVMCSPLVSFGQTAAGGTQTQPTGSLADSLQRAGNKELHIFYVHGIGSLGPGDYDSWSLRRAICALLRDCTSAAGELDAKQREYADQDEFSLTAQPPGMKYLGEQVWKTTEEWRAAAPYVVHWKLTRSSGPLIYVDEINWWPLVLSLKCRQIIKSDAALVGPSGDSIKLCSRLQRDPTDPARFISYDWIPATEAQGLLNNAHRGALVNRKLKNGLLDWGFSDAVLALGPLRNYLLDGIRQLILKSVAIAGDDTRGNTVPSGTNQEYVIVSHSLGSYLIFAALDVNPATPKTPTVQDAGDAFGRILAHTSLVYFFANQLRLLELAGLDGTSDTNLVRHLETWGRLRCDYLKSLPGSTGPCARPRIIALNDPSDLLTWMVPDIPSVDVHNVLVKNAPHWFRLFENPTKAHDNYARSKNAIGELLKVTHH